MPVLTSAISIEIVGGIVIPLLIKDAKLPNRVKTRLFLADKQQRQMEIHVVYGQNVIASDNHTLARFVFDGLSRKSEPFLKLTIDKKMQMSITVQDRTMGLRHDVEGIDLSHMRSPSITTPPPYISFQAFFEGMFQSHYRIGPKIGEVDELVKVMLRLLAPDSIRMFLTNRDDMLDRYDLSSQQRVALALINAEMVEQKSFPSLYAKVKDAVEYLEEHPDAVLCPTCAGTGDVRKVR